MFKKLNAYLIRETAVPLRTYAAIGLVSFAASALVSTALRSVAQQQRQPGIDARASDAHASADQCANDRRLVGLPRDGLGLALQQPQLPLLVGSAAVSGNDGYLGGFPSPVDGQLKYSRRFVRAGSSDSDVPRAWVPGLHHIPQTGLLSAGVAGRDTVAGSGDMQGRTLLVVSDGAPLNVSPMGAYLVDTTGPWR